jgi:hypothetical protein
LGFSCRHSRAWQRGQADTAVGSGRTAVLHADDEPVGYFSSLGSCRRVIFFETSRRIIIVEMYNGDGDRRRHQGQERW